MIGCGVFYEERTGVVDAVQGRREQQLHKAGAAQTGGDGLQVE